jgi:hypothetical protein
VERALTLWANGVITLQMVIDEKSGKGGNLPRFMNIGDSHISTAFNEATWGSITRIRMDFINNVFRTSSLDKIIEKAKAHKVNGNAGGSRGSSTDGIIPQTSGVQMVDLSDSDDICKCIHELMLCTSLITKNLKRAVNNCVSLTPGFPLSIFKLSFTIQSFAEFNFMLPRRFLSFVSC